MSDEDSQATIAHPNYIIQREEKFKTVTYVCDGKEISVGISHHYNLPAIIEFKYGIITCDQAQAICELLNNWDNKEKSDE